VITLTLNSVAVCEDSESKRLALLYVVKRDSIKTTTFNFARDKFLHAMFVSVYVTLYGTV